MQTLCKPTQVRRPRSRTLKAKPASNLKQRDSIGASVNQGVLQPPPRPSLPHPITSVTNEVVGIWESQESGFTVVFYDGDESYGVSKERIVACGKVTKANQRTRSSLQYHAEDEHHNDVCDPNHVVTVYASVWCVQDPFWWSTWGPCSRCHHPSPVWNQRNIWRPPHKCSQTLDEHISDCSALSDVVGV